MIHSFTELRERAGAVRPQTVAVACAHDAHTLEAVLHAAPEGILNYLLIGHPEEILSIGRSLGHTNAPLSPLQRTKRRPPLPFLSCAKAAQASCRRA